MWLILAAHHDDALLSIPELLLQAAPGASVQQRIVVVFSDEDAALEVVCEELHRQLALTTLLLGLPEARKRGVPNRQIFRTRRNLEELRDDPLVGEVGACLRTACIGATALLAPLSLLHLDHALVRAAAERIAVETKVALMFYADEPYTTLWPKAGKQARRGMQPVSFGLRPAAPGAVQSLLHPLLPFVGERDLLRLATARQLRGGLAAPLWRSDPADRTHCARGAR